MARRNLVTWDGRRLVTWAGQLLSTWGAPAAPPGPLIRWAEPRLEVHGEHPATRWAEPAIERGT